MKFALAKKELEAVASGAPLPASENISVTGPGLDALFETNDDARKLLHGIVFSNPYATKVPSSKNKLGGGRSSWRTLDIPRAKKSYQDMMHLLHERYGESWKHNRVLLGLGSRSEGSHPVSGVKNEPELLDALQWSRKIVRARWRGVAV